mmetsp:Transcript_7899/g.10298  ORF Transcript_7899/g.10298 Transcript_7899/m.10298 type:complete len:447 (+) Transcript_7899:60-1400(+)
MLFCKLQNRMSLPFEKRIKNKCREILLSKPPGFRTSEDINAILEYTSRTNIFPASLDDKEVLNDLCQNIELVSFAQNSILFIQGQPATSYFIIFTGSVEILQTKDTEQQSYLLKKYGLELKKSLGPKFSKITLGKHLCSLPENKGFGELALIKEGGTRATSALIQKPTEIIEIGPELYDRTIKSFHLDQANIGEAYNYLQECKLCKSMSGCNMTKIAYTMEKAQFPIHHTIINKGDTIDQILFIKKGELKQVGVKEGLHIEIALKGPGTIIGASELLHHQNLYHFTYQAMTVVEAYTMPLESFQFIQRNPNGIEAFFKEEEKWKKLHQSRGAAKLAKIAMAVAKGTKTNLPSLLAKDLAKLEVSKRRRGKQQPIKSQEKRSHSHAKLMLDLILHSKGDVNRKTEKERRNRQKAIYIVEDAHTSDHKEKGLNSTVSTAICHPSVSHS